jgi:hypothetical protein
MSVNHNKAYPRVMIGRSASDPGVGSADPVTQNLAS